MTSLNLNWASKFLHPMIDVVIHVEGKTFPANKSLLSTHSGYFRAVLSHSTTSLILPTVPAEYFSLILSFMSTNHLEINDNNVYQLLLYAQLLQMPQVVLQCRTYLASRVPQITVPNTQERVLSSTIVRPIPNKVQAPVASTSTNTQPQLWKPWLYSASLYHDWISRLQSAAAASAASAAASSLVQNQENIPTPQAESPPPILVTTAGATASKKAAASSKKKAIKESQSSSIEDEEDLLEEKLVEFEVEAGGEAAEQTLETAACDGPVRFQRILNPILSDGKVSCETEEDESVDVVSDDAGSNPSSGEPFKNFVPKNEKDGATYKCLFCNHIFKSHYCYQKHKRRHLNPFMVDYTISSNIPPPPQQQLKKIVPTEPSNNPPLKDINVQFFPCKICGAKFPSYYFVHKHKKIWHPESVTNSGETLKKSMDQ